MPSVFYTFYTPVSDTVSAIRSQEHLLGRMLLNYGLSKLYGLALSPKEFSGQELPVLPEDRIRLLQVPGSDCSSAVPDDGNPAVVSLGSHNGKPFVEGYPDIHFNISHCEGLVVCAFHTAPIGVDVELPGYFADILICRALAEEELSFYRRQSAEESQKKEWFFRFWTLKEAYVKCSGTGVDTDLTAFAFTFPDAFLQSALSQSAGEFVRISCSDKSVNCFQTMVSHGQILSVCFK